MKLQLTNILDYIDDFANDKTRENYPIEERIRDINYSYFSVLSEIDRLKGVDIVNTDTSTNFNEITLGVGESIKPLAETTDISFVTIEYDGEVYNLTQINNDDTKYIETLKDLDNTRPTHYILRDKNIEVFPINDIADTKIRVYQSERATPFSSGTLTAEPIFNEDVHMLLVFKPLVMYFVKRDMSIPQNIELEIAKLNKSLIKIYSPNRRMKISFKEDLIR